MIDAAHDISKHPGRRRLRGPLGGDKTVIKVHAGAQRQRICLPNSICLSEAPKFGPCAREAIEATLLVRVQRGNTLPQLGHVIYVGQRRDRRLGVKVLAGSHVTGCYNSETLAGDVDDMDGRGGWRRGDWDGQRVWDCEVVEMNFDAVPITRKEVWDKIDKEGL